MIKHDRSVKALKICFVDNDFFTPSESRPAHHDLIAQLTQEGYHVTLLVLNPQTMDQRKRFYQNWDRNLFLALLSYSGPPVSSLSPAVQSYHIMEWLLENPFKFDVVHFSLKSGVAYYTLLAKHQGWAFQETLFNVDCFSAVLWQKHLNQQWIDHIDDLAIDFFERESVRLADLVSCNDELFNWMKARGWHLPANCSFFSKKSNWLTYSDVYSKMKPVHQTEQFSNSISVKQNSDQPLVSVCLTHFNRPHYLAQALDSLRNQDYQNFELILVDDASTQSEALTFLEDLKDEFQSNGWKIIRNEKTLFPGAARNLAVKESKGKYLLFMDDDNYAKPHQISTFIQVVQKLNADILTCAMDVFSGSGTPINGTSTIHRFLPMGAAISIGLYVNLFGDMNALIKKEVYEKLGGLTEEGGVGGEDWEFFSRAVLHGYHLETVPQALFWYRDTPGSITKTTHLYANSLRGISPYLNSIPEVIRNNLILSHAQQEKLQKLLIERQDLKQLLKYSWFLFVSRARQAIRQPRRTLRKILDFLLNYTIYKN